MMLSRLIAIAFSVLPALIMATIGHKVVASMLTILGAGHLSNLETAMALAVPYLILVYCAIYRPIVKFFDTLKGKIPPGG